MTPRDVKPSTDVVTTSGEADGTPSGSAYSPKVSSTYSRVAGGSAPTAGASLDLDLIEEYEIEVSTLKRAVAHRNEALRRALERLEESRAG
jgi:hypothetical protein